MPRPTTRHRQLVAAMLIKVMQFHYNISKIKNHKNRLCYNTLMNIVFPEFNNPIIQAALQRHTAMRASGEPIPGIAPNGVSEITALSAPDLTTACAMVKSGQADTMIAGIDYSSRDVILACREHFAMAVKPQLVKQLQVGPNSSPVNPITSERYSTFSGLAVMQKDSQIYLLADMAACKHPNKAQLTEIIHQTHTSASKLFSEPPRVALLSFSTFGSGGHDDTIELLQTVRQEFQASEILLDGEMQLDAAINPTVAQKKFPNSPVAGQANVLIVPDLNSGNILYKAFEHIAGFHVAGPILQGFEYPVSDLSRGSSIADVVLTIEVIAKLTK